MCLSFVFAFQVHSSLEAKEKELREREKKVKQQINAYVTQLATDLHKRQLAVESEQKALKINTKQVLKLTSDRM